MHVPLDGASVQCTWGPCWAILYQILVSRFLPFLPIPQLKQIRGGIWQRAKRVYLWWSCEGRRGILPERCSCILHLSYAVWLMRWSIAILCRFFPLSVFTSANDYGRGTHWLLRFELWPHARHCGNGSICSEVDHPVNSNEWPRWIFIRCSAPALVYTDGSINLTLTSLFPYFVNFKM